MKNSVRVIDQVETARGQSLVLIALLLVSMLAFLGLVIDGGQVYVNKRDAQDAADSAALAGARLLASHAGVTKATISNTVSSFANENGLPNSVNVTASFIDQNNSDICLFSQPSCNSIPGSATGVRVTVTVRAKPYFINVTSNGGVVSISAVAAAQSGTPTAAGNAMPLAIPISATVGITYGQALDIWGDKISSGSFQWVSFGCVSNPQDVAIYLDPTSTLTHPTVVADPNNVSTSPSVNPTASWLCTSPGAETNSAVQNDLDAWLDRPESERHWMVAVFNYANCDPDKSGKCNGGANAKYHVVKFAEIVLLGYALGGAPQSANDLTPPFTQCSNNANKKCIEGKFIKFVTSDGVQFKPGSCNTNNFAACGIGLAQ